MKPRAFRAGRPIRAPIVIDFLSFLAGSSARLASSVAGDDDGHHHHHHQQHDEPFKVPNQQPNESETGGTQFGVNLIGVSLVSVGKFLIQSREFALLLQPVGRSRNV